MELRPFSTAEQRHVFLSFLRTTDSRHTPPNPENRDFWRRLDDLTDHGRALFIGMAAAKFIQEGIENIGKWQRGELLEYSLNKEMDIWKSICEEERLRDRAKRFISIATACGGIDLEQYDEAAVKDLLATLTRNGIYDQQTVPDQLFDLAGSMSGNLGTYSLEPDLLGEYFLRERWHMPRAAHIARRNAIRNDLLSAWEIDRLGCAQTLNRLSADFPDSSLSEWLLILIDEHGDDPVSAELLTILAVDAIFDYGDAANFDQVANASRALRAVAGRFPGHSQIQFRLARGFGNAMGGFGEHDRWRDFENAYAELRGVAERFLDDAPIQVELGRGMVTAIANYGRHARWDDLDSVYQELLELAARFPDSAKMQLERAFGAFNIIVKCGPIGRWEVVAGALRDLDYLGRRFPQDLEIARLLARALANAANLYESGNMRADLDSMDRQIGVVARRFPDDHEIQLQLASTLSIEMVATEKSERWGDLDRMYARLEGATSRFRDDRKIQLYFAKGTVNASNAYLKQERLKDLDLAYETLVEVANRYPDDEKFQLQFAMGTLNVLIRNAKTARVDKFRSAYATLKEISHRYPDDLDVQLVLVRGAGLADFFFGYSGLQQEQAEASRAFSAIRQRFPDETRSLFARLQEEVDRHGP